MKVIKKYRSRTKRPRGSHTGCVFETPNLESPAASTAFIENSLLVAASIPNGCQKQRSESSET